MKLPVRTGVKTRPPYVRTVVRDAVALSVGFGLGVLYSQMGGSAPDLAEPPAQEQRTVISSRGQRRHLDGRAVAIHR